MTNFLLRFLHRRYPDMQTPGARSAVGTLSGIVGIGVNLMLFAAKLLTGIVTGSLSITADAMNNLSDASGSILTLIGFRLAGKPADARHPYGHARYEYLSALAVAAMILLIGFELAKTSVTKILNPAPVEFSLIPALILVLSIGMKLWLSLFNGKLGKAIQSNALAATAADSRNDCIATAAVLAASLIESAFDLRVDGVMGLGVAVFILRSGWELAKETISPLIGEGACPELRQKIADDMDSNPRVLGYHDLMVHDYGPGRQFASIHVEMDSREDPMFCHELIDEMERDCYRNHGIHLVIHYDPIVTDDPELDRLKTQVNRILQEQDPRLSIHDFRMVKGGRNTNLIFDVSVPVELAGEEQEQKIQKLLSTRLNEDPGMYYHLVLTFDIAQ